MRLAFQPYRSVGRCEGRHSVLSGKLFSLSRFFFLFLKRNSSLFARPSFFDPLSGPGQIRSIKTLTSVLFVDIKHSIRLVYSYLQCPEIVLLLLLLLLLLALPNDRFLGTYTTSIQLGSAMACFLQKTCFPSRYVKVFSEVEIRDITKSEFHRE